MSLNNNNPYNDLLGIMRNEGKYHNPLTPLVGKVVETLPNIEVHTHTMPLYRDDLLIDKWLKDRNEDLFTEDIEAHTHTTSTEVAGETSHSHTVSNENEHKHEIKEPIHDKLKVDDKVVLLKINDKFIIISKVVSI